MQTTYALTSSNASFSLTACLVLMAEGRLILSSHMFWAESDSVHYSAISQLSLDAQLARLV